MSRIFPPFALRFGIRINYGHNFLRNRRLAAPYEGPLMVVEPTFNRRPESEVVAAFATASSAAPSQSSVALAVQALTVHQARLPLFTHRECAMPYVRDRKPDNLKRWVQIAAAISSGSGILIAGVSVGVGIHQFSETQRQTEFARFEEAQKLRETQALEARRPYLEQKLKWCTEAIEKAAAIATDGEQAKRETKIRFWQLYSGVMAMIENKELESAMVTFGGAMDAGHVEQLKNLSLQISYACRDEMAREWSPAWNR